LVLKKILLTGSSGFIGSHLLQRINRKYNVYCLQSDLTQHEKVQQEIIECAPDLVVHLAARTEVEQSFYQQTVFSEINYVGTVNLIEALIKFKKIPKLIFASTMEVYGWQPVSDLIKNGAVPEKLPVFDSYTTPNPNAPYAIAKLASEKYIEYAHRAHGLQYINIRQTNSYGRKDNNFFVTENIISQMLANDVCALGYKDPYRNFIFITDLIDAWETLIDNFDKCANNKFTLGPDNAIKIEDYAKMIARILNWNGEINWNTRPVRPGEVYLLNSNSEDLTALTGWKPKVDLKDGLTKTIEIWKNK